MNKEEVMTMVGAVGKVAVLKKHENPKAFMVTGDGHSYPVVPISILFGSCHCDD